MPLVGLLWTIPHGGELQPKLQPWPRNPGLPWTCRLQVPCGSGRRGVPALLGVTVEMQQGPPSSGPSAAKLAAHSAYPTASLRLWHSVRILSYEQVFVSDDPGQHAIDLAP